MRCRELGKSLKTVRYDGQPSLQYSIELFERREAERELIMILLADPESLSQGYLKVLNAP